jgi:hypothetical protein
MLAFLRGRSSVLALVWLSACGGTAVVEAGGQGGAGGGASASANVATSAATGTSSAASTSSGTTGAGGSSALCEGLSESACIGAHPDCVPVYDDACCPSCDPGGCADCVDYFFHHCVALDTGCLPEEPATCGLVPGWACTGKRAECGPPVGSPSPCGAYPGCIAAVCSPDVNCPPDVECHPVSGGTCVNACDSVPPSCPEGTLAESDGFCYTGYCIRPDVCMGAP